MSAQVVTYRVDDATTVKFEIEPLEGFRPAGPGRGSWPGAGRGWPGCGGREGCPGEG
jgi:hypothetical protein